MSDTHDHDHEILTYADDSRHDVDENARYVLMAEAIRELLIEKGTIKAGDVRLNGIRLHTSRFDKIKNYVRIINLRV